jgi:hypothetical protein
LSWEVSVTGTYRFATFDGGLCRKKVTALTAVHKESAYRQVMGVSMLNVEGRHPSTQQAARWFAFDHLPAGSPQRLTSSLCHDLAEDLIDSLNDGPELTLALRHLEQAKNYAVHQAIQDHEQELETNGEK